MLSSALSATNKTDRVSSSWPTTSLAASSKRAAEFDCDDGLPAALRALIERAEPALLEFRPREPMVQPLARLCCGRTPVGLPPGRGPLLHPFRMHRSSS